MKLTVKQLRNIIKEEVENAMDAPEPRKPRKPRKPVNKIIKSQLGSGYTLGGGFHGGQWLDASPMSVKWVNGPLHPDDIESLNVDGVNCPVLKREKIEKEELSWTTGGKKFTIPAHTEYVLYFRTPSGRLMYKDSPELRPAGSLDPNEGVIEEPAEPDTYHLDYQKRTAP